MNHPERAGSLVRGASWVLLVGIALSFYFGNCSAPFFLVIAVIVAIIFFNGMERNRKD